MTTMIRMMPSHRRDNSPSRLNKATSEQRINGAHETILNLRIDLVQPLLGGLLDPDTSDPLPITHQLSRL